MRKSGLFSVLLSCVICFALCFAGCKNAMPDGKKEQSDEKSEGNILITFFSRADENYGVGNIEKGNTHILAEMIAEQTQGTLFHIQRNTPYPAAYNECTEEAQREKNANLRPALLQTIDIKDYDIVFLGYPIWWSDMPMPVYTFLESQSWSGKTIIPFSTNEGSGLAGTVNSVKVKCVGATVSEALSMRGATAQNNHNQARQDVTAWLSRLNMI